MKKIVQCQVYPPQVGADPFGFGFHGYKGKEIAEYIQKDPTIVTRHLKEKKGLKKEIEKVIKTLRDERINVNSQV